MARLLETRAACRVTILTAAAGIKRSKSEIRIVWPRAVKRLAKMGAAHSSFVKLWKSADEILLQADIGNRQRERRRRCAD
jgi:hypothetical protein